MVCDLFCFLYLRSSTLHFFLIFPIHSVRDLGKLRFKYFLPQSSTLFTKFRIVTRCCVVNKSYKCLYICRFLCTTSSFLQKKKKILISGKIKVLVFMKVKMDLIFFRHVVHRGKHWLLLLLKITFLNVFT